MTALTVPEIIGHNIKQHRINQDMTAAKLGEIVGEVFGKPWARQTIYQVENGQRAMVSEEVAVFAYALGVIPSALFVPPDDVQDIHIGKEQINASMLTSAPEDPNAAFNRDLLNSSLVAWKKLQANNEYSAVYQRLIEGCLDEQRGAERVALVENQIEQFRGLSDVAAVIQYEGQLLERDYAIEMLENVLAETATERERESDA